MIAEMAHDQNCDGYNRRHICQVFNAMVHKDGSVFSTDKPFNVSGFNVLFIVNENRIFVNISSQRKL